MKIIAILTLVSGAYLADCNLCDGKFGNAAGQITTKMMISFR
jgi:hypothetical protein